MATFADLERQKTTMLARIEPWSPTRLHFQPEPGQWSAAQIVDHLVRSEIGILSLTRRGLTKPHRIGVSDRIRTRFIDSIFRSDRRVKVPASAAAILPDASPNLPAILDRWNAAREDLSAFLQTLTPEQNKPGVFRHPVAGWTNVPGVLAFFSVHIIHHTYQLNRIEAASQGI